MKFVSSTRTHLFVLCGTIRSFTRLCPQTLSMCPISFSRRLALQCLYVTSRSRAVSFWLLQPLWLCNCGTDTMFLTDLARTHSLLYCGSSCLKGGRNTKKRVSDLYECHSYCPSSMCTVSRAHKRVSWLRTTSETCLWPRSDDNAKWKRTQWLNEEKNESFQEGPEMVIHHIIDKPSRRCLEIWLDCAQDWQQVCLMYFVEHCVVLLHRSPKHFKTTNDSWLVTHSVRNVVAKAMTSLGWNSYFESSHRRPTSQVGDRWLTRLCQLGKLGLRVCLCSVNDCTASLLFLTRLSMEIQNVPKKSERRYVCCIVAIRSGCQMVGRFQGMLYLSAEHSRSLVWWENSTWKAFWRTFLMDQLSHLVHWLNITSRVLTKNFSKRNPVGKQRERITLTPKLWECRKPPPEHSHILMWLNKHGLVWTF